MRRRIRDIFDRTTSGERMRSKHRELGLTKSKTKSTSTRPKRTKKLPKGWGMSKGNPYL